MDFTAVCSDLKIWTRSFRFSLIFPLPPVCGKLKWTLSYCLWHSEDGRFVASTENKTLTLCSSSNRTFFSTSGWKCRISQHHIIQIEKRCNSGLVVENVINKRSTKISSLQLFSSGEIHLVTTYAWCNVTNAKLSTFLKLGLPYPR